jgi:hypothetical protein
MDADAGSGGSRRVQEDLPPFEGLTEHRLERLVVRGDLRRRPLPRYGVQLPGFSSAPQLVTSDAGCPVEAGIGPLARGQQVPISDSRQAEHVQFLDLDDLRHVKDVAGCAEG